MSIEGGNKEEMEDLIIIKEKNNERKETLD